MRSDEFEAHLHAALVTRPVIEQAKGILVLARCLTPQQAHAQLQRTSRMHDVDLSALAAALVLVAGGRSPGDPLLRKVVWQEWGDVVPSSCR
jgi:two-component system, response regulator / RNA-binding antiterminator